MTLSSPKRCHARPTTKASNCRAVSCSVAAGSCPGEGSSLTKRPACRPRVAHHTEAIVHEQLDARGAQVREKAARVCARRADCVDNDVEQSAGPGAHVLRLTPQPQCVDAVQRAGSSARAQRVGQRAQLRGVQRARTGSTPTKIRLVVTDFKSGLRELRPAPDTDKGAPEGRPAFLTPCKHRIRVPPHASRQVHRDIRDWSNGVSQPQEMLGALSRCGSCGRA
jgi:hypothetical protein